MGETGAGVSPITLNLSLWGGAQRRQREQPAAVGGITPGRALANGDANSGTRVARGRTPTERGGPGANAKPPTVC